MGRYIRECANLMLDLILTKMKEGNIICVLVFMDFGKAFDTIELFFLE